MQSMGDPSVAKYLPFVTVELDPDDLPKMSGGATWAHAPLSTAHGICTHVYAASTFMISLVDSSADVNSEIVLSMFEDIDIWLDVSLYAAVLDENALQDPR